MGDRANCIVKQNAWGKKHPSVWIYSHWGGRSLPHLVQEALQKRQRWDDAPYLTRIIFDVMTAGQQGKDTGYGITTTLSDNEHDLIVVDPENKTVSFEDEKTRDVKKQWSFEDFCSAEIPEDWG